MNKHPTQPLETDANGVIRFKQNAIVRHLVEHGIKTGCGLNELAGMSFPREDHEQLAQLIGYSLSGFEELDYVSDEILVTISKLEEAIRKADQLPPSDSC